MHVQSRNPYRERDHRISLMPVERPKGEPGFIAGTATILFVMAVAWLLITEFHAAPEAKEQRASSTTLASSVPTRGERYPR